MKVVATIEARMGSSRLPGKVMLPLAGKPMLEQLVNRIKGCKMIDEVIIVSSSQPENRVIRYLAERIGTSFFAGSEEDILNRVLEGTEASQPDVIVQLTGDNPAIAPSLIDDVITHMKSGDYDYVSNYLTKDVLLGQNLRCFKREALIKADKLCNDAKMRSHGGYFIQTRPDVFTLSQVEVNEKILRDDIRLTVDEPEDYVVMNHLFEHFANRDDIFDVDDILCFFDEHPDIKVINQQVEQKTPGEG